MQRVHIVQDKRDRRGHRGGCRSKPGDDRAGHRAPAGSSSRTQTAKHLLRCGQLSGHIIIGLLTPDRDTEYRPGCPWRGSALFAGVLSALVPSPLLSAARHRTDDDPEPESDDQEIGDHLRSDHEPCRFCLSRDIAEPDR